MTSASIQSLLIYILLNILFFYKFIFIKIVILSFLTLLIKFLFKFFFKFNKVNFDSIDTFIYKLKIKNKYINWFWVFIYILFFVVFIFWLRIYRIGFMLDLRPLKDTFMLFFFNKDYFIILFLLMILIIFIIIVVGTLKNTKNFFHRKLINQYLVSIQIKQDVSLLLKNGSVQPYIVRLLDVEKGKIFVGNQTLYLKFHYLFYKISITKMFEIYRYLETELVKIFLKFNLMFGVKILDLIRKLLFSILNPKYNFLIIPTLIFYDLYFNNFILTHIFYVLPFYFIYVIWYKLSEFLYQTRLPPLERVIYEMTYECPKVFYFDLTEEHLLTIGKYLVNNLKQPIGVSGNDHAIGTNLLINCRYLLANEKTKLYYNPWTEDYRYLINENK